MERVWGESPWAVPFPTAVHDPWAMFKQHRNALGTSMAGTLFLEAEGGSELC